MTTTGERQDTLPPAFIGTDKWDYPITSIRKCETEKLNQDMP